MSGTCGIEVYSALSGLVVRTYQLTQADGLGCDGSPLRGWGLSPDSGGVGVVLGGAYPSADGRLWQCLRMCNEAV